MAGNKREKEQAERKAREVKALFDERIPDEESAVDYLFLELQRRHLVWCKGCHGREMSRDSGERSMLCVSCKRIGWFTSDGFFDHAKNIRAWLFYFELRDQGITLSANAFSELAGIEFSSSLGMKRKVDMAVLKFQPDDCATNSSRAFLDVVCKRSRLTPAEMDPSAEEEQFDVDEEPPPGDLPEEEKIVFDCLNSEPVRFDDLMDKTNLPTPKLSVSLIFLQSKGLAQPEPGDRWKRTRNRSVNSGQRPPGALRQHFISFVRTYFQGISRKYMQPYLARFWIHRDQTRWNGPTLLEACLQRGKIELHELRNYVTPRLVWVIDTTAPVVPQTVIVGR